MVGEKFEIRWPQMAINVFKLSTMVGENFEICWPQMARNVFKLSTMIGEKFEIMLVFIFVSYNVNKMWKPMQ